MRLSRRRRNTQVRMNMTPMIDIVFLLIIFFMTVSQVSEVNRERLELPRLAGSEDQKPTILTLNVTRSGELVIGGHPHTLDDLVTLVSAELVRLGDDPGRLGVLIRGDQRGDSRMVNDIVRALTRLQIHRVRIAVEVP